jgi:hypothetical protein
LPGLVFVAGDGGEDADAFGGIGARQGAQFGIGLYFIVSTMALLVGPGGSGFIALSALLFVLIGHANDP